MIVDAIEQAYGFCYAGDKHIRYFGIFFNEWYKCGESTIRDHPSDCWFARRCQ